MKASVLYAIGDLQYTDVPKPHITKGEVLVKVKACGICGSDVNRAYKTGTYHFPTIIGHEFSGEVVDAAENDDIGKSMIGKRVGIFPLIPCKKCESCLNKQYEMCSSYNYLGSRCDGGFAEYVAVPIWNLIEIPDNVSFEEAAMLEPASVAVHALRRIGDISGKRVAIFGPGTIGNILSQVAKALGAKEILTIGRNQEKLDVALSISSDFIYNTTTTDIVSDILAKTNGSGVEVVIEGTGSDICLSQAIEICKRAGNIILMGNPTGDFNLKKEIYWQILRKQLVLNGTWNSSYGSDNDDWHKTVELIQSGKLKLKPIITHKLSFDRLNEGLEIMRNKNILSNKVMLINRE